MERRKTKRAEFQFFALEKKPTNSSDPQGDRVLRIKDFSDTGLSLIGAPRFNNFNLLISFPQVFEKDEVEVRVVHAEKGYFGVEFVNPSAELILKIKWWLDPVNQKISSDRNSDTFA